MRMHNPPHPGEIIKSLCLEPVGLTVTEAAEGLGVSRKTLSAILNGARASVPKWRYAYPSPLTPALRVGLASKCNTTCGMPSKDAKPSRSSSLPPKTPNPPFQGTRRDEAASRP